MTLPWNEHPMLRRIVLEWKAEADILRRRGAGSVAAALESCVEDLQAAVCSWADEPIPLAEAAKISGKSASQLRRDVHNGKLDDLGTDERMLVRRGDVASLRGVVERELSQNE